MIDESFLVRKLVSEFNSIQNTCYTIAFLCYAKVFFTKKMSWKTLGYSREIVWIDVMNDKG